MPQAQKTRLAVFGLYLILAIVLTWPLALHLNSAIPGREGDNYLFLWNHWHVKESLLHFSSPYRTDLIAWPLQPSLLFHSLTLVPAIVSSLLQLFLPLVLSFNIVFLLTLAAGACGMYLLLEYLFHDRRAALLGGLFFGFCPYVLRSALGHFNYASVFLIPFYVWFLLRALDRRSVRDGVMAGLWGVIALYTDSYYTVGLIGVTACVLFWKAVTNWPQLAAARKTLAALVLTAVVLGAPLIIASVRTGEGMPTPRLQDVELYSPDIRSLFVPLPEQSLFGRQVTEYYAGLGYHGSALYLTLTLAVLAVSGFFYGRQQLSYSRWFWLGLSGLFLVITLGPALYYNGQRLMTLPFTWLHELPFVNNILVTPHFIIFTVFGLTCLAAMGLKRFFETTIFQRRSRIIKAGIMILVAGLYIGESLSLPFPLSSTKVPDVYYDLAKTTDDDVILELPFALSTSFYTIGTGNAKTQYYQTIHGKKILSAWISRVPESYPLFYSSVVGLNYLISPEQPLPPPLEKELATKARANFDRLGIRQVIVHPEGYTHEQLDNALGFLKAVYDIKPQTRDGLLVYTIK